LTDETADAAEMIIGNQPAKNAGSVIPRK